MVTAQFQPDDFVLADRFFCSYGLVASSRIFEWIVRSFFYHASEIGPDSEYADAGLPPGQTDMCGQVLESQVIRRVPHPSSS